MVGLESLFSPLTLPGGMIDLDEFAPWTSGMGASEMLSNWPPDEIDLWMDRWIDKVIEFDI